jgi:acetolactate synthase-1/2/3 large subunit
MTNYKLPVKVLILNNQYLGMVRQWQELFFDNRLSGVDLQGSPDFVLLAEAYGAKGLRLENPDQIDAVLQQAMEHKDGPCIIAAEVAKEDNVFPMIPAGQPVSAMIIDPPNGKTNK